MTFLLDVNVLIALLDPEHVAHDRAHDWFERIGADSWATCAVTQNGVLRTVSNPRYPNRPGPPSIVAESLASLCALSGHRFWSEGLSMVGAPSIDLEKLATSAQVTDTYLLALAVSHGALLATLDRRLSHAAVKDGRSALHVIGEALGAN